MKKLIKSIFKHALVPFLITVIGSFSFIKAQPITIDFNDPQGLLAMPDGFSGAPTTSANYYREDGMLFSDGVDPDPELGYVPRFGHYHLNFPEDVVVGKKSGSCGFSDCPNVFGRETANGFVPVIPENENRTITPMGPGAFIQMIYDPNNDGVPDPFRLLSLVVHRGKLNVGFRSPDVGIGVYNNLTAGYRWILLGGYTLIRATLEFPVDFGVVNNFTVDEIVFEPVLSSAVQRQPNPISLNITKKANPLKILQAEDSIKIDNINYNSYDALAYLLSKLQVKAFGSLNIENAVVTQQGPAQDKFEANGSMDLRIESNGIDINNESVIVTVGKFQEMIPHELFKCSGSSDNKTCYFEGRPGGITNMVLNIRKNKIQFSLKADGLNLNGICEGLVPFSLQIGDDLGVQPVNIEKVVSFAADASKKFPPKIEENISVSKAIVYPNPATNIIQIKLENVNNNVVVELIDSYGNRIAQKNVNSKSSLYTSFDVSKLTSGIYWIKIIEGDIETIKKIVVEHK